MTPSVDAPVEEVALTPEVALAPEVPQAAPKEESSASERALIKEFNDLVKTPQFLRDAFEEMQADRAYVAEELVGAKNQDLSLIHI